MVRAPRTIPAPAAAPKVALLRRRPQVIVRAPGASGTLPEGGGAHLRTLHGLGFREEADTLPAAFEASGSEEAPPVSCVRSMAPSDAPRRRPVTLLDDIHDALSRDYLAEAEKLLASGLFTASNDG